MNRILLFIAFVLLTSGATWAQGVTTASISGIVKDDKGEGLPLATVIAVHIPSGTQYGTSTRTDGSFTIPNARVGGLNATSVSRKHRCYPDRVRKEYHSTFRSGQTHAAAPP